MTTTGFIPFVLQNLNTPAAQPIVQSGADVTVEFRVRFPEARNTTLPPTQLSGAIVTMSNGILDSAYCSIWYEKPAVSSLTGTIFLTSSNGRLELANIPVFDDNFYDLSLVKEHRTGSVTLSVMRHEEGSLVYLTSSIARSGTRGYPADSSYSLLELGCATPIISQGEFWGQEFRLWLAQLTNDELLAHSLHFENYGREQSIRNSELRLHWRLNDGTPADAFGNIWITDSTQNNLIGTGSNFTPGLNPFQKFLENYSYIPSIDYGWNQQKVRVYNESVIDPSDAYRDERFVSLEFNMYDALNEDISHVMSSYNELNNFLGLPVNRYRADYEGLQQMRETYFKRLQGELNFRVFVDMLDFFDTSFVSIVERLLPARALFKGDELVVESHMLERPKYQYQLRPVIESRIDISGSISILDRGEDYFE